MSEATQHHALKAAATFDEIVVCIPSKTVRLYTTIMQIVRGCAVCQSFGTDVTLRSCGRCLAFAYCSKVGLCLLSS
jgi:hypothetical protein